MPWQWLHDKLERDIREQHLVHYMNPSLSLLDTVIAIVDFREQQVLVGDLGTIVEVYSHPTLAYDVSSTPTNQRARCYH